MKPLPIFAPLVALLCASCVGRVYDPDGVVALGLEPIPVDEVTHYVAGANRVTIRGGEMVPLGTEGRFIVYQPTGTVEETLFGLRSNDQSHVILVGESRKPGEGLIYRFADGTGFFFRAECSGSCPVPEALPVVDD